MPFSVKLIYIQELENQLNLKFPDKYKSRMVKVNGGELKSDKFEIELYPFYDKSSRKRIKRTCNHIGVETKKAKSWKGFPDNSVAIGFDGTGNYLILIHEDSRELKDEVFMWYHETCQVKKIANSIEEIENKK